MLQVELVSPERILFSGEAEMVLCRTSEGEIAFLTGHTPLIGALGIGQVRIKTLEEEKRAAVHGGFVEVRDDRVIILSDVAELAEHIDADRARRALDDARRRAGDDDVESEAAVRRAQVRLDVASG